MGDIRPRSPHEPDVSQILGFLFVFQWFCYVSASNHRFFLFFFVFSMILLCFWQARMGAMSPHEADVSQIWPFWGCSWFSQWFFYVSALNHNILNFLLVSFMVFADRKAPQQKDTIQKRRGALTLGYPILNIKYPSELLMRMKEPQGSPTTQQNSSTFDCQQKKRTTCTSPRQRRTRTTNHTAAPHRQDGAPKKIHCWGPPLILNLRLKLKA